MFSALLAVCLLFRIFYNILHLSLIEFDKLRNYGTVPFIFVLKLGRDYVTIRKTGKSIGFLRRTIWKNIKTKIFRLMKEQ